MSTLKADTIQSTAGGAATLTKQTAAKHFVNMDAGTTINDSFNTSSIADNGTGNHASTLTNAMGNIHYVVTGSNIGSLVGTGSGGDSGEIFISNQTANTTTKYEFRTRHNGGTYYDNNVNGLHLSGDLA
tara:strand:+ start:386 stop:772 length:387 start_codon:yes stop_codon:yes gene_type:complete